MWQAKFKKIAHSKKFENFINIVILLTGVVVGLQTSPSITSKYGSILDFFDNLILLIFAIEIIINILAEGKYPWRFFYDSWHIFDFLVVAVCFVPFFFPVIDTQYLVVIRLARILRFAKIFEKNKNLKILLTSLLRSIPSMTYVVLLLMLLFYVYGIIATDLFGKVDAENFGSIWISMKRLLFITFEGWSSLYESEGIQKLLNSGFPDWIFSLFFISFQFIAAMIFLNLFIGIITSDMESTKENEKRGKSPILYTNHTLILGWSQNIFKIIEELIEANYSKEKAHIVILAERDKNEIDLTLRDYFENTQTTKISFRNGSPQSLSDLIIANAWESNSIIILKDDNYIDDMPILKSIIALINHKPKNSINKFHITAEISDQKTIKIAKSIASDQLIVFNSTNFLSRIITQSTINHKLTKVISEIIGFQGSELYIVDETNQKVGRNLIGKTFYELLFDFQESCPFGILNEFNGCVLNPPMDYVFKPEDKLVILAEDDSTIKYSPVKIPTIHNYITKKDVVSNMQSKNFLILGSNNKLELIICELSSYIKLECNLTVVPFNSEEFKKTIDYIKNCNDEKVRNSFVLINDNSYKIGELNVTFSIGDITDKDFLVEITKDKDDIIILSNNEELEMEAADSITLVSLIHLRDIAKEYNRKYSVVVELLNKFNEELAKNEQVSDYIIGSTMVSSILAQLSEERELEKAFNILFTSEGSELYFRRLKDYADIQQNQLTFAEIIDIFSVYNETAIGYIYDNADNEYVINPNKKTVIQINEHLQVIVLAEE